jgi:hypothetical protein
MSSTLRKFSQIPVRTKYLLGILAGETGPLDASGGTGGNLFGTAGASVIVILTPVSLPPVATTAELNTLFVNAGATSSTVNDFLSGSSLIGKLFKDMGRQVTVYDAALPGDLHIATYRECQFVSGSGSEGVADAPLYYSATLWVRVWSADGTGVSVARTG